MGVRCGATPRARVTTPVKGWASTTSPSWSVATSRLCGVSWSRRATGDGVRGIDGLQFDLGIGPVADVMSGKRRQAGQTDLASSDGEDELLTAGASHLGIGAVFAVGVALPVPDAPPAAVEMSRAAPGALPDAAAVAAHVRAIAIAIADDLLVHLDNPGVTRSPWPEALVRPRPTDASEGSWCAADRRHLVAATAIQVADRTSMSVLDSLSRLRGQAFRDGRSLVGVALRVLEEPSYDPR